LIALDLIIEDLNTKNLQVRTLSKELECESELNYWKETLLSFINERREEIIKSDINPKY
jgi:hypothetical protein